MYCETARRCLTHINGPALVKSGQERPPRGGLSEIRSGVLLPLMAEANSKLKGLLAQSTRSALHQLGDFNNRRSVL